jgi:hypothetical protein
MREILKFGNVHKYFNHFCPITMVGDEIYFQDCPHKINCCKNRFLDTAVEMMMGKFRVTVNHLICLTRSVPKSIHGLCNSDLKNSDPMNYTIINKLASDGVLESLKSITNSIATREFLKMMKSLLDAFMDIKLKPLERVYNCFYVLFVLRYWRDWCMKCGQANLKNFITTEAFVAIEINCWCLLKLMILCRDRYGYELFLVFLFNSQICEKFFGKLRTHTSTGVLMVNFSPLEIFQRVHKIQLEAEIEHELMKDFYFRNNSKDKFSNFCHYELPSDSEIEECLERAFEASSSFAQSVGIWTDFLNVAEKKFYPSTEETVTPEVETLTENLSTGLQTTTFEIETPFVFQNITFLNESSGKKFLCF